MHKFLFLALFPVLLLASCETPAQNARLAKAIDIAIKYAARHGVIDDADAKDLVDAKIVVLEPDQPKVAP